MVSAFVLALLVFALVVFLLSVFAPSTSTGHFWMMIRRLRNILDLICYWIFNLFGIAAIVCIVWGIFQGLFAK